MESIKKQLQTDKVKMRIIGNKTIVGILQDQNSIGIFFKEKFTDDLTFYPFANIIKIEAEKE